MLNTLHPIAGIGTDRGVSTVLRWMGSKRRLAVDITTCLPPRHQIDNYYEPFFGSGAVFFNYQPPRSFLGDTNAELMNAWEQIRTDPTGVWRGVSELPASSADYYAVRSLPTDSMTRLERAIRFVFLNRYCFNGIYRTNRRDEFNVPFGKATGAPPPLTAFEACARSLANSTLSSADFEVTISNAGKGDVVYLDPPWESHRPHYGEYGYSDHPIVSDERIADAVLSLHSRGADVFLSLPKGHGARLEAFHRIEFDVAYSVASQPAGRGPRQENLFSNIREQSGSDGSAA